MKICAVRLVHIAAFDKNYLNNTLTDKHSFFSSCGFRKKLIVRRCYPIFSLLQFILDEWEV